MPIQITGPIQLREEQEKPAEQRRMDRRPASNRHSESANHVSHQTTPEVLAYK